MHCEHTNQKASVVMNTTVIDPALKGEASASLCESICGIQKRTGRINTDAYDPVRQKARFCSGRWINYLHVD